MMEWLHGMVDALQQVFTLCNEQVDAIHLLPMGAEDISPMALN